MTALRLIITRRASFQFLRAAFNSALQRSAQKTIAQLAISKPLIARCQYCFRSHDFHADETLFALRRA
jgi:hypothetical protein